jgi:hypothetical protein
MLPGRRVGTLWNIARSRSHRIDCIVCLAVAPHHNLDTKFDFDVEECSIYRNAVALYILAGRFQGCVHLVSIAQSFGCAVLFAQSFDKKSETIVPSYRSILVIGIDIPCRSTGLPFCHSRSGLAASCRLSSIKYASEAGFGRPGSFLGK